MQKILILEDEIKLGEIYQQVLQEAGFEVQLVSTSSAAISLAKTFPADLLLIDHGLKNSTQSGIEILPELKSQLPKAKAIIFSNYSDFHISSQAKAAGADDIWVKINFTLKKLVSEITQLLAS